MRDKGVGTAGGGGSQMGNTAKRCHGDEMEGGRGRWSCDVWLAWLSGGRTCWLSRGTTRESDWELKEGGRMNGAFGKKKTQGINCVGENLGTGGRWAVVGNGTCWRRVVPFVVDGRLQRG